MIEYEFKQTGENSIKVECASCGTIFEAHSGYENEVDLTQEELDQAFAKAEKHKDHQVVIYQSILI